MRSRIKFLFLVSGFTIGFLFWSIFLSGSAVFAQDRGSLEYVKYIPVLHVEGTPGQMGEQYGRLVGDQLEQVLGVMRGYLEKHEPFSKIPKWARPTVYKALGFAFWTQFPTESRKFLAGILEGGKHRAKPLNFSKYELAFLTSIIDISAIAESQQSFVGGLLKSMGLDIAGLNCDSFAAWGSRTVGGKTFQTRNTDLRLGTGMELFPLVVVYKPRGLIPYVSASFVGQLGVVTGLNARGVGLGQIWAASESVGLGAPWQLQMRDVLSQARDAWEAVHIFKYSGARTYGSNFIFADSQGHGFSVEATPRNFAVFADDDPREDEALWHGQRYDIRMKEAVFRSDVAMDPTIRSYQTSADGPKGDSRPRYSYQVRYKKQADMLQDYAANGILIGPEQAEAISRQTADPSSSLQTAVYANNDLILWVSYARIQPDGTTQGAYQGEYVEIPFYRYVSEADFP